MGVSLTKGQSVSLNKLSPTALKNIQMGLGWDVAKPKSSGLFGMFGRSGGSAPSIDLDASCVLLDANANFVEAVWFRNLTGSQGAIKHTGDNLTGAGDGDDETIKVNLSGIPAKVTTLVFLVNSFRGQTFDQVENAYCRVVNTDTNAELARFNLSCQGSHTGQIMAKLTNESGEWSLTAIGVNSQGRTFEEMMPAIKAVV